jgi:hypothetical protein
MKEEPKIFRIGNIKLSSFKIPICKRRYAITIIETPNMPI